MQGVKTGGGEGGRREGERGALSWTSCQEEKRRVGRHHSRRKKTSAFQGGRPEVQEVRETVTSSAAGRANHQSLQPSSRRIFVCTDQFQIKEPLAGASYATCYDATVASFNIFRSAKSQFDWLGPRENRHPVPEDSHAQQHKRAEQQS